MNDGAHLGVNAERALKTILGGAPPPSPEECESPATMLQRLRALPAPTLDGPRPDYGEACDQLAGFMIRLLLADPKLAQLPLEERQGGPSFWKACEQAGLPDLGYTGFQAGWAFNAARRCVELGPEKNPAVIEIHSISLETDTGVHVEDFVADRGTPYPAVFLEPRDRGAIE